MQPSSSRRWIAARAIQILKKGIDANPSAWRLHQHLGYIYWKQGNFQAASETYGQGAAIPGAPPWMEAMKAQMAAKGGSRSTAHTDLRTHVSRDR